MSESTVCFSLISLSKLSFRWNSVVLEDTNVSSQLFYIIDNEVFFYLQFSLLIQKFIEYSL